VASAHEQPARLRRRDPAEIKYASSEAAMTLNLTNSAADSETMHAVDLLERPPRCGKP